MGDQARLVGGKANEALPTWEEDTARRSLCEGGPAARPKRRPGRVRPRPAALPATARPPASKARPPQAPFISTDPRCAERGDLGNDPQIQSQ